MKNLFKKKLLSGITLIELLVSVSLFAIIVISTTQIFIMVLQAQRRVVAIQNVQESIKYFFEVASKEIRTAVQNTDDENFCDDPNFSENSLFGLHNNTLYLRNQDDECVKYFLGTGDNEGRFMIERKLAGSDIGEAVPLSPDEIIIDELSFNVVHRESDKQALVTINVLAKSKGEEGEMTAIRLQTSIASRFYRWE